MVVLNLGSYFAQVANLSSSGKQSDLTAVWGIRQFRQLSILGMEIGLPHFTPLSTFLSSRSRALTRNLHPNRSADENP
jgi:hypothetical protein